LTGIPVASGSCQTERPFDAIVVQLRPGLAVGVKDKDLAAIGLNEFPPRIARAQLLDLSKARATGEEDDYHFFQLAALLLSERVTIKDRSEIRRPPQDHPRIKAELIANARFNPGLQQGKVSLIRFENRVAALQDRARIAQPQQTVKPAQFGHLDFLAPADIDAAQERYDYGYNEALPYSIIAENKSNKFGICWGGLISASPSARMR